MTSFIIYVLNGYPILSQAKKRAAAAQQQGTAASTTAAAAAAAVAEPPAPLKAASETDDAADDEEPPLVAAARVGQTGEVSSLVEDLPSSIDVRNKEGETALMAAAENNHAGTVAVLVEKKSDVNARNKVRTNKQQCTHRQCATMVKSVAMLWSNIYLLQFISN